ncbi:SAM-dependent methyltransferase [Nocardia thraciensis]
MTEITLLEEISLTSESRTTHNSELLQSFYEVATHPYIDNWGYSFHLPPFASGQTLEQACVEQERQIARIFRPGQSILDIGCGVGGPARTIAAIVPGLHITAINIIAEQLAIAEHLTREAGLDSQIDYVAANFAADLPFSTGEFDGAYSIDALCHSPNKAATYREIHRVLKSGAVFTGTDWMCSDNLSAADYSRWIEPVCHFAALPEIIGPSEAAWLLTEAGFAVESCRDMAEFTNLGPNWDLFDNAAAGIANRADPAGRFMYYHCTTTAAAGRVGKFTIGAWIAAAVGNAVRPARPSGES